MNAIELARQAYAPTTHSLKSDRDIEAQLVGKVTATLRRAASKQKTHYPEFVEALHQNREMWAAFAVDVAGTDNTLSKPLRAQIFYLAEFTELHSSKILRGEADVDPLIEINTSVLRGLNANGVI